MAEPEVEEKLVAEFANVRYKKQLGVLLLTSVRVAWGPGDILQTFQANFPYQQIKAQRISAETSSKIQLQLVLLNGSHVNFHFTASNALEQRQQAKEHLARALSKASTVQISPELEAKNNLLKSNPGIYQLYKDLVIAGLISTEEFWANQSLSIPNSDAVQGQESGLPSAFLADVQAVYDGCNAVRYNLSADGIQAIFKTYPTVKKKHSAMVPQQMKEEEFWTQFFQSQFFHHEGKNQQFSDCLSHDELKGMGVGVAINLSESVHGLLEEGYSSAPEYLGCNTPSTLIQRCNNHSQRVLEALMEGSSEMTASGTTPTLTTPPHLKLSASCFSQASGREVSSLPLAHSLTAWQLQQDIGSGTAHAAIPHLAPGGSLMSSGIYGKKVATMLTKEQQQEVFRHQTAIAELLRHFWSCFPTRTAQLEAKVHKMHQCLVEYNEKQIKELEEAFGSTDSLTTIKHLHECISKASQHYHKWLAKKKRT